MINTIGCAFGQYLVDTLALAWVVATDSGGTEIAVHGSPGDILVYPTNLVAKRWQSGERAFIVDVGTRVVADIEALRYRAPT